MSERYRLPSSYQTKFTKAGKNYRLITAQVLRVPAEKAFSFFEDPANLFEITPDWLDFKPVGHKGNSDIYEGAEFDFTIRWLSVRFTWRTRITAYRPPERFTDVQIRGPYRHWEHTHIFEEIPEGTLMHDEVTYRIPLGMLGRMLHGIVIRKQLEDIFSYRAYRIAEWSEGIFKKKQYEVHQRS